MAKRDYYEILGIKKGAAADEIKKGYRQKAKELHPDRNSDNPKAEEQFKEANEAHEILKDPEKKAAYDRYGHAAFDGGMGGGGGGQARRSPWRFLLGLLRRLRRSVRQLRRRRHGRRAQPCRNAAMTCAITYASTSKTPCKGMQKTVNVPAAVACGSCKGTGAEGGSDPVTCPTCSGMGKVRAQQGFFTVERTCPTCNGMGQTIKNPCKSCHGQGRVEKEKALSVNIPAGVETGTRIRLAGEGEAGMRGGPTGDLYIFIEVADHKLFERDNMNLYCQVPVSIASAAPGRRDRSANHRRWTLSGENPRGLAIWSTNAAARQGHARPARRRRGRYVHRTRGRNTCEPHRAAKRDPQGVRCDPRPRTIPTDPTFSSR